MNFLNQFRAILWKDFVSEFRTKDMILSMCLFSFLILVIFSFSFDALLKHDRDATAGILWVAFIFSGLTGLGRSFGTERDNGTLQGLVLCPVSPWTIFLGKLAGVFLFTTVMEFFTLLIATILYSTVVVPFLLPLGAIMALGTLGVAVIGTLFSAVSTTAKNRDVLLSILFFPISVPLVIAAVKATGTILNGRPFQMVLPWVKILIAFDLVFLLVSYLTFAYIMEE